MGKNVLDKEAESQWGTVWLFSCQSHWFKKSNVHSLIQLKGDDAQQIGICTQTRKLHVLVVLVVNLIHSIMLLRIHLPVKSLCWIVSYFFRLCEFAANGEYVSTHISKFISDFITCFHFSFFFFLLINELRRKKWLHFRLKVKAKHQVFFLFIFSCQIIQKSWRDSILYTHTVA